MVRAFVYIFLLVTVAACGKNYMHRPDENIVGQTPPPDMVVVPGNGDLPSFYMGFTEECNVNYNTYLVWLDNVFADYPAVAKQAQIKNRDVSDLMLMNDPYYKYYQNHPAFAYYPVTGLTWLQVQDYMGWKTDRLNEMIMVKINLTNEEDFTNQVADNNFNTEAYLCEQYMPVTKNEIPDLSPEGTTRHIRMEDGILFTAMRLPTEAEWDYAVGLHKKAAINIENYKDPFGKGMWYPYGKEYFTLHWADMYGLWNEKMASEGLPYNPAWDSTAQYFPGRLTGPSDFERGDNHIANLEGNVQEWLLDIYEENPEKTPYNFVEYFTKNGFPLIEKKHWADPDGLPWDKDSLGRMTFRYFALDATGTPYKTKRLDYVWAGNCRNDTIYIDTAGKKVIVRPFINWENKWDTSYSMPKDYHSYIFLYKNADRFYYLVQHCDYLFRDTIMEKRIVKGGTWRHPDALSRRAMAENEYSPNVGFRCVMAYNSLPVKKKYRVKWR